MAKPLSIIRYDTYCCLYVAKQGFKTNEIYCSALEESSKWKHDLLHLHIMNCGLEEKIYKSTSKNLVFLYCIILLFLGVKYKKYTYICMIKMLKM